MCSRTTVRSCWRRRELRLPLFHWLLILTTSFAIPAFSQVAPPAAEPTPADAWVSGPVLYPAELGTNTAMPLPPVGLSAESLAGDIQVTLDPSAWSSQTPAWPAIAEWSRNFKQVTLYASADEVGHWPARDWHSWPMRRRGQVWQAFLPVDHPDVPVIYFAAVAADENNTRRNGAAQSGTLTLPPEQSAPSKSLVGYALTPMRRFMPRQAGLTQPSRVFTPLLDGFESGTSGWRLVESPDITPALALDREAHSGSGALRITVPAGLRSVTAATTGLRGWHVQHYDAIGLRLWMRTRQGAGRVRIGLLAHAMTERQSLAEYPDDWTLTSQWQPIVISFTRFAGLPLSQIDLLTVQCIARGPCEFLVDDVELLGRW